MRIARLILLAVAVVSFALGYSCARAAEVEWMVTYDHTSDITRGAPFNEQPEPQADYIGGGATLTVGEFKRFEIDLTHGRKLLDRQNWQRGSKVTVRYYPLRGRQ
jgi:hypothetical protein